MYSVFEALSCASLLGVLLGAIYTVFSIFLLLIGDQKKIPPSRLPDSVELPLLKKVRIAPKHRCIEKRIFVLIRFLFDIFFFTITGILMAVFVYSVGGVLRLSYMTVAFLSCIAFCMTLGKLLLLLAAYIRFCTILAFLYLSFPIRLLLRFFCFAFAAFHVRMQKIFDAVYIYVYAVCAKRRYRDAEKSWHTMVENVTAR